MSLPSHPDRPPSPKPSRAYVDRAPSQLGATPTTGRWIDVRSIDEFAEGHAPGASCVPLEEVARRADDWPRDEPIVVFCRSGNRSGQACAILARMGFEDLTNVAGGMIAWTAGGRRVETGGAR